MKSTFKKLPGSIIDLDVSLETQEFHSYWQTAYDRALSGVQIKGFRPGAAPKELADKGIDKEKVFDEAAQEAVRRSLNELSQDKNWTIIDQPKIEITDAAPDAGLKYSAKLVVFPEIELGNYKKIAKKVLGEKQAVKVLPEEIEKNLNWLRESRAKLTRVSRGAAKGDVIEINAKSYCEGKSVPGGEIKGDKFILGESRFLAGFDDELINHKEGETVKFSLFAPTDYWNKELQGRQVDFETKIIAVFERALPELNDEFARGLGANFQNLELVKESIAQGLSLEKEKKEHERLRLKILEEIVKSSKIDPPQIMIDKTLDSMALEVKAMIRPDTANLPKDEELRAQFASRARERVLANLVIHKIVQAEHLEPTREEVEAEARNQNLDPATHYDYSYGAVQTRKVFAFLESLD